MTRETETDEQRRPTAAARLVTVWRAITSLGRAIGLLGGICLLVGLVFGWHEMVTIGVAFVLALVVGLVTLLASRSELAVELALGSERVEVGETATAEVIATNANSHRSLPARLEVVVGRGEARLGVPSLARDESHEEILAIPTNRRAVVPIGPARSVHGDPLGLVRREVVLSGHTQIYVHPATVVTSPLSTGWMRDLEGVSTNDRTTSDVAFHTLREYVIGDDRRHVHWRTTARMTDGTLMVREFVDTRRAHIGVLMSLEARDYASDDEFELAVSMFASVGRRCIHDAQQVDAFAGTTRVPTTSMMGFLDTLAGVEHRRGGGDLAAAGLSGHDPLSGASIAALVTGSVPDESQMRRATSRLGRHTRVLMLRAQPGATSEVTIGSTGPRIIVGDLDDLPGLIRLVVP